MTLPNLAKLMTERLKIRIKSEELVTTKEPIMFKPGSISYRAASEHFGQPAEKIANKYQEQIYHHILNICSKPTDSTEIIEFIRTFDLEETILKKLKIDKLENVEIAKLCSYITFYVNKMIEMYQPTFEI